MDKKYLKWSLVLSILVSLIILGGMIVYAAIPWLISALVGMPAGCDAVSTESSASGQTIAEALSDLCNLTKSIFATTIMVVIIFGSPFVLLNMIISLIDLNEGKSDKKNLWALAILLLPTIGALLYYFKGRKSDSV